MTYTQITIANLIYFSALQQHRTNSR